MTNPTVDPSMLATMEWRSIGPFRGGRTVAVAGHPTDPLVFYFGACAGGVWKTSDAGAYWENVSDGFFSTAAVGAIAVAESDPNVLYAGTGEACIRGNVSHGDGVYRSTDGGKTWKNAGLQDTRHIGRVRVHPNDPDLVYVAALGHAYGPNDERGVFRSRDGGGSWECVLFRSNKAGAVDLSMDPRNPRILYAAIWETVRTPWSLTSGGDDSGLYRSTDGGDTWTELSENPGMPAGIKGRIGVAVSPVKTDRVWVIVEAEEGGLLRSDDGGESWETVSADRALQLRPWYYSHVFADPHDAETVHVLNTKAWKSTDGGRTFAEVPTPHGDNHDLWIDAHDPQRMIEGNDGGACVSLNGGDTWSTIYNQPTAQFYHVATDTQFPYRVYATQQDNSAVSVPSRSHKGAIHWSDCYPTGNSESGHIAVRPDDPNIVYSGAIGSSQGGGDSLLRYNHRTGEVKVISIWPELYWGWGAKDLKYRFQWTYPILISPHDPNVLYAAGNVLFKTEDEGMSWRQISPDLTRNDASKMEASGGPITLDTTGVEHYCTIFAFAESPHERGVLWCGSDDGLVHISQDDGTTWRNITPKQMPEWTLVGNIELSAHDPASAYIAATRYKQDDNRPYLYKTSDYGENWTEISEGIPEHDFTRVIREDPARRGLLYAGTETGIYVSFDDGGSWQSLQRNLPTVPVLDLAVRDNELVAATNGRSFWMLDDLTLLRQLDGPSPDDAMGLFSPAPTYRIAIPMEVGRGSGPGKNYNLGLGAPTAYYSTKRPSGETEEVLLDAGKNPPNGVVVSYCLQEKSEQGVTLTFTDGSGRVVRSFSSETPEKTDDDVPQEPVVPNEPGMNRFVWDMRHPRARSVPGDKTVAKRLAGPLAPPGAYEVHLTVGGQSRSQRFELVKDPRIATTQEDFERQAALLLRMRDRLSEAHDGVNRLRDLRRQMEGWVGRAEGNPSWAAVSEIAAAVDEKLSAIEGTLVQTKATSELERLKYPSTLNAKLVELTSAVASADSAPTQQSREVFDGLTARIETQLKSLREVIETDVAKFIDLVHELEIPAVVPKPAP